MPPLRPAAFFCAVAPPCFELERDEPEEDALPPRDEEPGELAIFAARDFDMPFSFSFSYCFSMATFHKRHNGPVKPQRVADRIRKLALSFPETYEDEPWGHPVFKVSDNRMFAAMSNEPPVRLTVKLTAEEREIAMLLPYVSVARYVGRYGWVTAEVTDEESLEAALEWLRESYWLKAPPALRKVVE